MLKENSCIICICFELWLVQRVVSPAMIAQSIYLTSLLNLKFLSWKRNLFWKHPGLLEWLKPLLIWNVDCLEFWLSASWQTLNFWNGHFNHSSVSPLSAFETSALVYLSGGLIHLPICWKNKALIINTSFCTLLRTLLTKLNHYFSDSIDSNKFFVAIQSDTKIAETSALESLYGGQIPKSINSVLQVNKANPPPPPFTPHWRNTTISLESKTPYPFSVNYVWLWMTRLGNWEWIATWKTSCLRIKISDKSFAQRFDVAMT